MSHQAKKRRVPEMNTDDIDAKQVTDAMASQAQTVVQYTRSHLSIVVPMNLLTGSRQAKVVPVASPAYGARF